MCMYVYESVCGGSKCTTQQALCIAVSSLGCTQWKSRGEPCCKEGAFHARDSLAYFFLCCWFFMVAFCLLQASSKGWTLVSECQDENSGFSALLGR